MMDDWLLWVIAAVLLGIGEIFTLSFFLAPFAGGALAAAFVAALGGPLGASLAVFVLVSAMLLLALRPVARAHLKTPARLRTGTQALIGRGATVRQRIDDGGGAITIDGEVWTARPYIEGTTYEPGARVSVMAIRGATALVSDE